MIPATRIAKLARALPFWMSLALFALIIFVAGQGGWWLVAMPMATWWLFTALDAAMGLDLDNADPDTPDDRLIWYRLITLIWFPLQLVTIFGLIWYATRADHLSTPEAFGLFFGVGILSGTIGITYSHEMMHQKNRLERWLADLLLACVLYSHFRSEHLLVHHRYVGTPRDPVTARYNEGFHRFFPRVLRDSLTSAFTAERAMLARRGKSWTDLSNPFWRYWLLQGICLMLALALGGWLGLGLFVFQAAVAVWQLELTNYTNGLSL